MDGTSYFPSRPEMEANLATFAERTGVTVRYDCRWTGTRRIEAPTAIVSSSRRPTAMYRCRTLVLAVGVAEPYTPPGVGMEHTHHYADVRPVESYADRRVFIIGKQNSGFELASGLLPWARQIVLASPSKTRLSVETQTLVGVRARYVQPYEDFVLGGGVSVLDAAIDRIEGGRRRRRPSTCAGPTAAPTSRSRSTTRSRRPASSVRSSTCPTWASGPSAPAGCRSRRRGGRAPPSPASSSRARSARVPRVSRSTASRPTRGPSTALATTPASWPGRIATERFGIEPDRPHLSPDAIAGFVATELAESPELFHQRGYLARVLSTDPAGGLRDDGVQPLTHVLDGSGQDGLAATLEADGSGAIYPVVYTRIEGKVVEQVIEPDPLMRYDTADARTLLGDLVKRVVGR